MAFLNEDGFRSDQDEDEHWSISVRAELPLFQGFTNVLAVKEANLQIQRYQQQIDQKKGILLRRLKNL